MTRLRVVLAGGAVAVHAALWLLGSVPSARPPVGDEGRYLAEARAVLAGEKVEPDLLWPPLYRHFLAAGLALGHGSLAAVRVFQTLLLLASALLLRDLALRLSGPGWHADLVAALAFAFPPLAAFAHAFWPEILHLALLVLATWILAARRERLPWLALLGVVLGLALLAKSLLGPFLPVFLAPVALGGRARAGGWRAGLARLLVVLVFLVATVAPTVVANWRLTGLPVVADSSWFNLWVGLTDTKRKDHLDHHPGREYSRFKASAPDLRQRNRLLREQTWSLLSERGVAAVLASQLGRQYFRLLDKDSVLTDQLPGGALARRGRGYRAPPAWLAQGLRWTSYLLWAAILGAGAAGLFLCRPGARPWVWVALAFVAYNLAIFLLLHVKARYRVQLMPFLILFAAAAAAGRGRGPGTSPGEAPSRGRRLAAGAAVVAAELFAFGGPLLD